jgi:hypothetical protein
VFSLDHQCNPDRALADACTHDDAVAAPYRIDVFATDVASVVSRAGGWLYDHAARGWRVMVIANDTSDPRPLRILGVDVVDLGSARAAAPRSRAYLLKTAAELLESDPKVQQLVLSRGTRSHTELALWGRQIPCGVKDLAGESYRVSEAAYAFKRQALIAANVDLTMSDFAEEVWCGAMVTPVSGAEAMNAVTNH